MKEPTTRPCIGCEIGFPLYTSENDGKLYHEDGAGGIMCGPGRLITDDERAFLLAMVRSGNVTTDPAALDEEDEPS